MPAIAKLADASATQKINARVIPVYLNEFQVEELYGIPVARLRKERCLRIGIPYVSMPRFVRYRTADVEAYLEAHRIQPEQKPFTNGRGRPRKDGTPANAATGSARRIAEVDKLRNAPRWDNPEWAAKQMAKAKGAK